MLRDLRDAKSVVQATDENQFSKTIAWRKMRESCPNLDIDKITKIDDLIKLVKDNSPTGENREILMGRMAMISQNSGEDIQQFKARIERMHRTIYELIEEGNAENEVKAIQINELNEALKTFFRKGLKREIRREMPTEGDFRSLVRRAKEIESEHQRDNTGHTDSDTKGTQHLGAPNKCQICGGQGHEALFCKAAACVYCKEADHCSYYCNNTPRKIQLACRQCNNQGHSITFCKFYTNNKNFCQYCQDTDHEAGECSMTKQYEICYICKQPGHLTNNCPKLMWNRSAPETNKMCNFCGAINHTSLECEEIKIMLTQNKSNHQIRCYNCHEMGHIARNCQEMSQQRFQPTVNNQNPVRRAAKFCDFCTRTGHMQAECFKLKAIQEAVKVRSYCAVCNTSEHNVNDCPLIKELGKTVQICQKCKALGHTQENCQGGSNPGNGQTP